MHIPQKKTSTAAELSDLLGGHKVGDSYLAPCPVPEHNDRTPSLSLRDGHSAVLLTCHGGCPRPAVFAAIRNLGIAVAAPAPSSAAAKRTPNDDKVSQALDILRRSRSLAGTIGERYLREARGVLNHSIPSDIRFSGNLWHSKTCRHPGLVCPMRQSDGSIAGVHRTWLAKDGSGKVDHEPKRAFLGYVTGGAIRLTDPAEALQVCEGLEDALAVMRETGRPTWGAGSAPLMRTMVLPPEVRRVILFPDADTAGEEAAQVAARRWLREGRGVRIVSPPDGCKDWAEAVAARIGGAA